MLEKSAMPNQGFSIYHQWLVRRFKTKEKEKV
jgi:hypothetical protein